MAGKAKAEAAVIGNYKITEADAAKLNNTVNEGDVYPFLPVSVSEDGTTTGHLFLPHTVTVHTFQGETPETDAQEGES